MQKALSLIKNAKGAIFDLDGTLLDSLWIWAEIDKRFLSRRGITVPSDYSESIGAMGFRATAEYTIKRFNLADTPEELMDEWMKMSRDFYATEVKLKPSAKEFLLELAKRGTKLAIATSSTPDLYMPALKNNGVDGLFSVVMDTSEVRGKDHPDVYLAVANKLDLQPSECVVFEDLPVALSSAKRGGFAAVAVYDEHYKGKRNGEDVADYFVEGYEQLLAIFR